MKLSKGRWVEALLLAPATFVLGSGLSFGIIFTALVLVGGLSAGWWRGQQSLLAVSRSGQQIVALLLMMLAAAAGLVSLWLTVVLGREWVLARLGRKRTVVLTLVAGLAAVAYWLFKIDALSHDAGTLKAFVLWLVLLLPPTILALRYLSILLPPLRNSHGSSFR